MNAVIQFPLQRQLSELRDEISKLLPGYESVCWLERFDASANAEQCRVWDQFSRWLLLDEQMGVYQYAQTDEQRALITRAANGRSIDYDVIFGSAIRATTAAYAAAYSDNPAAICESAYPAACAMYTASHVGGGRAALATNAHASAHFAAGRTDAAQAQAEQLLSLMSE